MGKLFSLDSATKQVIQDAFDDFLVDGNAGGLAKTCRLYYPPKSSICPNCLLNPAGSVSSNFYRDGGPLPFPNGTTCPVCNGVGRRSEEVSELLALGCQWEQRQFYKLIPDLPVRTPFSFVQIKGFQTDLPKIQRMNFLVFETKIEGLLRQKYRLWGEPGDASNIIQGRYFVATLERI